MNSLVGQVVKGYEFKERLGAGGFGTVYRAYQLSVGRDVAIKLILPERANEPEFIRRFEIEAQLVARLEHPHIVPLHDYWRGSEGAYLVMRWLPTSLRAALAKGPWSVEATLRLLEQIAAALSVAHRHSVIHRDVKPENVLLDEDANAYLADFGIAKSIWTAEAITAVGALQSSPAYTSPEQIRNEPTTAQTDIYSLGVVLHEILTGDRPFNDATTPGELIARHLNEPLPSLKPLRGDLPPALDAVIQMATAKEPAHRYPDVLRLAAAFRAALPPPRAPLTPQPLIDPLTERELEILHLLREGLSNGEIAARLVISLTTVKWYVRQIFSKLDVHDRNRAVERAEQLRLFDRPGMAAVSQPPLAGDDIWITTAPERPDVSISVQTLTRDVDNPYKGLRAYQEGDAADFFGREALTAQLIARMAETDPLARFLAVVGPSGSGKSSAVRAGLVPALRQGALPDSARWFFADMLPGTHPLEELEATLLRIAINPPESLINQLREDERGLARAIKRVLPPDDSQMVLIIDQCEEVFTLVADEAERLHFLNSLCEAVTDPRGRLRVVLTLRADFYDRPLLYERFAGLLQARTELVLPLSTEELARAIVRPAGRVGVTVDADLLATLLKDVGEQPGTLPLLEYTLSELFERQTENRLTAEAYRASGGLFGTLARRADDLYEGLNPAAREAAHQMFLRLVTLGEGVEDTRRRVPTAELVAPTSAEYALDEALEVFGQYRLLSFDNHPLTRAPTVEVAHEALIRHWGRLRAWLDDSREDLYVQRRLMVAAAEWSRAGREPSYLASGARLAQFEALDATSTIALNPEETAYLAASAAERQRQETAERERKIGELALQRRAANRLRYLAGVLALFLVVAVMLSAVALTRGDQLAKNLAHSEAVRLALESLRLHPLDDTFNELIALLAIRSVRTTYTPQGDQALVRASQGNFPAARLTLEPPFPWAFDGLYSPDGNMLFVTFAKSPQFGSQEAELWLWDAHTFQKLRQLEGSPFSGTYPPMWSPDSRYVLAGIGGDVYADGEAVIHMWDTATGRVVHRFSPSPDTLFETYGFSPDQEELYAVVVDPGERYAVRYWDVQTGAAIRRVELPFSGKSRASIWPGRATHPDAQELALITVEGEAPQLWDLQRAVKIRDLEGITGRSQGAVFSPSLRYVAMSISDDSSVDTEFIVRVWDVNTGQIAWTFSGFRSAGGLFTFNLDFSHDDRYLATGNTSNATDVRLWDLTTGREVHRWDFEGASVSFSPDGKTLAIAHHWGGAVLVFPLQGTALPQTLPHPSRVRGVAVSHGGTLIATAGGDGVARLWNAQTFVEEQRMVPADRGGNPVTAVYFFPDDRYMVSTGGIGTDGYRLWDVQSGQQVWYLQGQQISRYALDFTTDGKWMIVHDADASHEQHEIQVVEVGTGQVAGRLLLPSGVTSLACAWFSPDDRYVAVMSEIALPMALLWEWGSNQPPLEIVNAERAPSRCGAFTPDGKYLFLGGDDGIGRLHDVTTGAEVRRFLGHTDLFLAVAASPDGKHILTTSNDNTARIWELATGKEVRRFTHDDTIWGAAYFPDGSAIVIGSYVENAAFVYRTDLNQEIVALCARLTRDFTPSERQTYGIPDDTPTCPRPGEPWSTQTPIPTGTIPVWTALPLTPLPPSETLSHTPTATVP